VKFSTFVILCGLGASLAGCAESYSVAPVADGAQQVRYWHGKATTYSEMKFGAVQVTPLGVNSEDRVGFAVAVFNKSGRSANFGIENLALTQEGGEPERIFTSMELAHEAKVRAQWAQFGMILLGATDAALTGRNAYSTSYTRVYTPYGSASAYSRTYNPEFAYLAGRDAGIATGHALVAIQASLDNTLTQINDQVLQTTTVDPGQSYGGIAIADTLASSKYPQDIVLHVNWAGEDHVFKFSVAKGVDQVVRQASQSAASSAAPAPVPYIPPTAPSASYRPATTMVSFDQWNGRSGVAKKALNAMPRSGIYIEGADQTY
jgi:hypothetical protein